MQKGRRKKVRYIQKMPQTAQFSPRGKPGRPDEVELKIDEYETIKLADYQGYDQSQGAQIMGISRPSFGRILRNGRKIIADALVNGKIIRIRIGDVQVGVRQKNMPLKNEILNEGVKIEEAIRKSILKFTSRKSDASSLIP
ncbi:MAG: DUF134 domain-containing protein [Candidatus Omnitrophica bacterium]|nr:DUF134 domain-containing protein [Candidatus Omnitrophota bacterium]MBU1997228.1 DUF134 domain-containing protein [Candidatus Omnitrophota bacterium]MBU4333465.1 DUF134 domain-containing protein [Candidatus Omnitrophota bacterium]